jgi:hypothetical protein
LFRSHEVNQRTEARGLEKRHKGNSKCVHEDRDRSKDQSKDGSKNQDKGDDEDGD